MREFLRSSGRIEFAGCRRAEIYAWVERTVVAQRYGSLGKGARTHPRHAGKVTGLSVSQMTRLIRTYPDTGKVQEQPYRRHRFDTRYTDRDSSLLAEVDRAHERLSGPATRCILRREYEQFGRRDYERLSKISVAHLYNLRRSARYRNRAAVYKPTPRLDSHWGTAPARLRPSRLDAPCGPAETRAGLADSSERYLIPVLGAVLEQFPFVVLGFS